jgi:monofunctional chorismate mutase
MPRRTQEPRAVASTIERKRREIDALDDQLVALLERRAECALAIGRAKRASGVPVRDNARETAILERLAARARGPLDGDALARVFRTIFQLMRQVERTNQESRP